MQLIILDHVLVIIFKNNLGMILQGCGSLYHPGYHKLTQGLVYFWLFICLMVQAFGS